VSERSASFTSEHQRAECFTYAADAEAAGYRAPK